MLTKAMNHQRVRKKATLRCYICGSPQVFAVCHHCGHPLCKEHANALIPKPLGFSKALMVELGWVKSPDDVLISQGIFPKRVLLLDELLHSLRLIDIWNPEFDNFDRSGPPKQVMSMKETIRRRWKKIRRKIADWLGIKGNDNDRIGKPYHCFECSHYVVRVPLRYVLLLFGMTLASFWAIFTLWQNVFYSNPLPPLFHWIAPNAITALAALIIGLIFTPFFTLLLGVVMLTNIHYFQAQKTLLGPIPLPGRADQIHAEETCTGSLTLDDQGSYRQTREKITGKLTVPITFNWIDHNIYYYPYMQRAKELGLLRASSQIIQTGFLLLPSIAWENVSSHLLAPFSYNIYPIVFPPDQNPILPLLFNQNKMEERREFTWEYEVPEPSEKNMMPVQLVASLPANSDRRMLELEIELTDLNMREVEKTIIEELNLWLPGDMGIVARIEPEGYLTPNTTPPVNIPGYWQQVQWKGLTFISSASDTGTVYRQSIYIQFEQPFDTNRRLFGNMRLKVPSAYSGLNSLYISDPFGEIRSGSRTPVFKAKTLYNINLDLTLSCLRYQRLKSFSDEVSVSMFPGTPFIINVTKKLSQENFYIKRITENPSRTSKEGADRVNRYWDISGRRYEGIYPIDFHLVVIGEEVSRNTPENQTGNLKVIINVQGSVTNEIMEKRVEGTVHRLKYLIEQLKG